MGVLYIQQNAQNFPPAWDRRTGALSSTFLHISSSSRCCRWSSLLPVSCLYSETDAPPIHEGCSMDFIPRSSFSIFSHPRCVCCHMFSDFLRFSRVYCCAALRCYDSLAHSVILPWKQLISGTLDYQTYWIPFAPSSEFLWPRWNLFWVSQTCLSPVGIKILPSEGVKWKN